MRLSLVLLFAGVFVLAGCDSGDPSPLACSEWGYGADNGPDNWAAMCSPTCAAEAQSPIDIVTSTAAPAGAWTIDYEYGDAELTLFNNGHTIEAADEAGTGAHAITVDGKRFEFLQFHFHSLSEHTIDGQHSPIELHLVHRHSDTELTVLGIMIVEGPANEALAAVWNTLPPDETTPHSEVHVDLAELVPTTTGWFRYAGSLTTPNGSNPSASCAEIVNWLVMDTAITMSAGQIGAFQDLFDHNYRPVQPLNGRTVTSATTTQHRG